MKIKRRGFLKGLITTPLAKVLPKEDKATEPKVETVEPEAESKPVPLSEMYVGPITGVATTACNVGGVRSSTGIEGGFGWIQVLP